MSGLYCIDVTCVLFHYLFSWSRVTNHLRPFQTQGLKDKGLVFPVEFTVGRLMDIVDATEEEHSGGMFDWAGQAIPF